MQQTSFQDTVEKIKSLLEKNNIKYTHNKNDISFWFMLDTMPNIEIITASKKHNIVYFQIYAPHWTKTFYDKKYDFFFSKLTIEEMFYDFIEHKRKDVSETDYNAEQIAKEKVLAMQDAKMGEMLDILNSTTLISAVQHMKTIIEKELKDMKYFVEEMKHMGADGNFTEKEYLQKKDEYNNHPHHLKLEIIYDRLNELLSESFLIKD
jgi:hypothetical protein